MTGKRAIAPIQIQEELQLVYLMSCKFGQKKDLATAVEAERELLLFSISRRCLRMRLRNVQLHV